MNKLNQLLQCIGIVFLTMSGVYSGELLHLSQNSAERWKYIIIICAIAVMILWTSKNLIQLFQEEALQKYWDEEYYDPEE